MGVEYTLIFNEEFVLDILIYGIYTKCYLMGEKENALENSYLKLCTEKNQKEYALGNLRFGICTKEFILWIIHFFTFLHHLIQK